MNRKQALLIGIPLVIIGVLAFLLWRNFFAGRTSIPPAPTATSSPTQNGTPSPTGTPPEAPRAESVARRLEIPWALDFLPDGSIIFTERPGRVRLIDPAGNLRPEPLLTVDDVAAVGEGGLLGIVKHPDFARNAYLYIYYTYRSGDGLANQVVRYTMRDGSLTGRQVILDGIPGAANHDGGRLKFGPDGRLYITTGDATVAERAQDRASLAGKILRVTDDGGIPPDNPFPGSPVYSWGHRNPEGLAWDSQGRLWATEHGSSATDELNLIQPGRNYGWPAIRGDQTQAGLESPVIQSGSDTWAPSGAAFWNGSVYFAGLRGQSLFQAVLTNGSATLRRYLQGDFGRLRAVEVGPDGLFYVLTSNRDGRGIPSGDDDQIIRVNPRRLA